MGLDPESKSYVFRVWGVKTPDPSWGLLVGDCVHNARSALDHLAYQLACLNLGRDLNEDEAKKIQFPIAEDPAKFAKMRGRIDNLADVDRARIEVLQSFNAWDESIWGTLRMPGPPAPIPSYLLQVHQLDIIDKHRTMHPTWVSPTLGGQPVGARELGITGTTTSIDVLSEGGEIGRWHFQDMPPEPSAEMAPFLNDYFPIHISLREPHFATGVSRILRDCIMAVSMVTDMFEPRLMGQGAPALLKYWDGGPPWF